MTIDGVTYLTAPLDLPGLAGGWDPFLTETPSPPPPCRHARGMVRAISIGWPLLEFKCLDCGAVAACEPSVTDDAGLRWFRVDGRWKREER